MKRGTPTIKRIHGRNYHFKQSQARLDETVLPFNSQVLNSLEVDFVPVQYYTIVRSGLSCTCDKVEIPKVTTGIPVVAKQGGASNSTNSEEVFEVFTKDKFNSLFGDSPANKEVDDSEDPYGFDENEDVPVTNISQIFEGGNTNCGVCYRSGYFNSYDMHRGTRLTLGTLNYLDAEGYNIDYSEAPNSFNRLHDDGYVLYQIVMPKYVKEVRYSVRNNVSIITEGILYDNNMNVLSSSYLQTNQGKKVEIVVREPKFTHVVLEFFTNIDPMKVNFAGISKSLDYTTLETLGNISIVLPMTISTVNSGDVIAAPSRNIYLKVVDVEFAQTATMRKLEWRVQCRVLQPTEALKRIAYHRRLS